MHAGTVLYPEPAVYGKGRMRLGSARCISRTANFLGQLSGDLASSGFEEALALRWQHGSVGDQVKLPRPLVLS